MTVARHCMQCDADTNVESVTVRMYTRRSQTEYRFRICRECRQILSAFLEGPAESVSRGLFDHRAGMTVPAMIENAKYRTT